VAQVDDPGHAYGFLEAIGVWGGAAERDLVSLGRLESKGVMKGMSGAPVRRVSDQLVVGVVSGRYNPGDGWGRDSVWVARTRRSRLCAPGWPRSRWPSLPQPGVYY